MADGGPGRLELFVFGKTRLRRDGQWVDLPGGQPLKVLVLLALNGGVMNRDTLVERLWPSGQADAGRHQLRAVLARLRAATGLWVERQDETVGLRDGVWCDLEVFLLAAARALSGVDGEVSSWRLGLHAQRLWAGPPLEAWRYEDWSAGIRTRAFALQALLWDMLDRVPTQAEWPPPGAAPDDVAPLPPLAADGREDLSSYRPTWD